MLSENKDSVRDFHMIYYLQTKIVGHLNQILKHPEFRKVNIKDLLILDELSIVVSDDKKLYNFSFDEKTGGTYRSRISVTHYTDFTPKDSTHLEEFNSFFSSDGYSEIYSIETTEGVKYVMTGYVRGCSYCFLTFVRLISIRDNEFIEEFLYSVNNRDWTDGVIYSHDTKTIIADYHIDDLTPYCYCTGEIDIDKFSFYNFAANYSINCQCKFVFNGLTFELVEESWKMVSKEDRKNR